MRDYDFSLEACMESVEFSVEYLHANPFEELGRSYVRAKQDIWFNKTMIKAWEKYIEDNGLRWDDNLVK